MRKRRKSIANGARKRSGAAKIVATVRVASQKQSARSTGLRWVSLAAQPRKYVLARGHLSRTNVAIQMNIASQTLSTIQRLKPSVAGHATALAVRIKTTSV
jgi:hypothetical protein